MFTTPPTIEEFERYRLRELDKRRVIVAQQKVKHHEVAVHQIIQAMRRGASECNLDVIPKQYQEPGPMLEPFTEVIRMVFTDFIMNITMIGLGPPTGFRVHWRSKGQCSQGSPETSDEDMIELPDGSDTEDINYATGGTHNGQYTGFLSDEPY